MTTHTAHSARHPHTANGSEAHRHGHQTPICALPHGNPAHPHTQTSPPPEHPQTCRVCSSVHVDVPVARGNCRARARCHDEDAVGVVPHRDLDKGRRDASEAPWTTMHMGHCGVGQVAEGERYSHLPINQSINQSIKRAAGQATLAGNNNIFPPPQPSGDTRLRERERAA
jgi:hypothetical protein